MKIEILNRFCSGSELFQTFKNPKNQDFYLDLQLLLENQINLKKNYSPSFKKNSRPRLKNFAVNAVNSKSKKFV
jgi:hypothetical protein